MAQLKPQFTIFGVTFKKYKALWAERAGDSPAPPLGIKGPKTLYLIRVGVQGGRAVRMAHGVSLSLRDPKIFDFGVKSLGH